MAILEVRTYPDPILREVSEEVSEFDTELQTLLDNMAETMYAETGIGLAAPQVAVLKRIIVIDISPDRNGLIELINPSIVSAEGEVCSEEGCLSVPEFRETVKRSSEIVVKTFDRYGKEFELEAAELLAICIQHEMDHLEGKLFIDRLSRLKREIFKRRYKKRKVIE